MSLISSVSFSFVKRIWGIRYTSTDFVLMDGGTESVEVFRKVFEVWFCGEAYVAVNNIYVRSINMYKQHYIIIITVSIVWNEFSIHWFHD